MSDAAVVGDQKSPLEKKRGRPFKPKRVEVEGTGRLRAMRFVLANNAEFDRSVEEHVMRGFLKKNPEGFMRSMNELEGGSLPVRDDGTDRVEQLIEKLLRAGVGDVG